MSNKVFVVATGNKGKLAEIKGVAKSYGVKVLSPAEIAVEKNLKKLEDIEETADTYEGNAKLKADAVSKWCGLPAIADDTGLEVEALNGAPGLYSARYAGDPCTPAENRAKMLKVLNGVSNRKAQFKSVICLSENGKNSYFHGELHGEIIDREIGEGGFGYDPIFKVDGYDKTLAELKGDGVPVKTHRALALEKFFESLK